MDEEQSSEEVERFDKAFGYTLAVLFVFLPLVLVPVLGALAYSIIITFFAGRKGGKYLTKRHALIAVLMASVSFLLILLSAFYTLVPVFLASMPGELDLTDPLGTLGIALFSSAVLIFSLIGGYTGGKPAIYFDG